ncbi:hypothetical protein IWQ62_006892, partial [Dispira parvispora]
MAAYNHFLSAHLGTLSAFSPTHTEGPLLSSPLLGSPLLPLSPRHWTNLAQTIPSLSTPLPPLTFSSASQALATALTSPPTGRPTPSATSLASLLRSTHRSLSAHDQALPLPLRSATYPSNLAIYHSSPPVDTNAPLSLPLSAWSTLRTSRLFLYPAPAPTPSFLPLPPHPLLSPPALAKTTWWQLIDRLRVPPQHRSFLWRMALNRVPRHLDGSTTCPCGAPESAVHLLGSCPTTAPHRTLFLTTWL